MVSFSSVHPVLFFILCDFGNFLLSPPSSSLCVRGNRKDTEDVLFHFLRHDAVKAAEKFATTPHECGVCMDDVLGARMMKLSCGHLFCRDCITDHCRGHVSEGSVQQLKCPGADCNAELSPQTIREVLGDQGYERWEWLLTSRALDSMADVVYCPKCQTPVIADKADNFAQCECLYAFCTLCMDNYHPGDACVTNEERLKLLKERAEKRKANPSRDTEALRKDVLRMMELESIRTVSLVSRMCPKCRTPIQKSAGCNKMTCSICGIYFCYSCGHQISGYSHFGSQCILFDGVMPEGRD
eukprot:m.216707 g.216707  ORF g.216707 m.216707 type:complete len:298 (-) comp22221_c1_seq12:398-1291(-)